MTVVQLHGKSGTRGANAPKGGIIAALDIGSTKISCLIAEAVPPKHRSAEGEARNGMRILGVGHQLSRGIRSGSIVNVDEAERAIRLAVDAAERMAQRNITEVYVNVSGGRPLSRLHSGAEKTQTGQVSPRDLDRVLNAALAQVDPGRRAILHLAPVQYHLDDARGIQSPVGMYRRNARSGSQRRDRREGTSQEPDACHRARPSRRLPASSCRPMRRQSPSWRTTR